MKNVKGITLIALVITIVVLIILAGVAISLSIGENGIFNKAKYVTEEYSNAQDYEETEIAKLTNEIDLITENSNSEFQTSTLLGDISLEIEEINGESIKVKVTATNENEVKEYGVIVNNELMNVSESNEIIVSNLISNQEYNIIGCAFDKNIDIKKSNAQTITTLNHQYLYKSGQEFSSLTGGWSSNGYSYSDANGKYTITAGKKYNDYMYFEPTNSTSSATLNRNILGTNNLIDLNGYNKMYVHYNHIGTATGGMAVATVTTKALANHVGVALQLGEHTEYIDISTINQGYIVAHTCNNSERKFQVYEIWLEK